MFYRDFNVGGMPADGTPCPSFSTASYTALPRPGTADRFPMVIGMCWGRRAGLARCKTLIWQLDVTVREFMYPSTSWGHRGGPCCSTDPTTAGHSGRPEIGKE